MAIADESPSQSNKPTDQSFLALTPIPTVLLDPSLRILQVSASFLSLYNLAVEECNGVGIYELIEVRGLVPEAASVRYAIETAQATKKVYTTEAIQAVGRRATVPRCWSLRAIPTHTESSYRQSKTMLFLC